MNGMAAGAEGFGQDHAFVGKALGRSLARAFAFGSVCAIIAFGSGGPEAALGALAGALAAGLYVATYLGSHLGALGERTKIFDARIARSALLRMVLTGLGAFGSFLAGRQVLLSYLLSFAAAFLVLLLFEIPNTRRHFQQRVSE